MKSNYISLINLPPMIRRLGPLVNMWDGGGKGEKFVQVVKPHIPRGIQTYQTFFPNLMEKLYKLLCLEYFEAGGFLPNQETEVPGVDEVDAAEEEELTDSNLGGADDWELGGADAWNCVVEQVGMLKIRTIYIYPNQPKIEAAMAAKGPFSGILVGEQDKSTLKMCHVLYAVYRKPTKSFGWKKINFHDDHGLDFFGLRYAPIEIENPADEPPQKLEDIKAVAKMAVVAIPMWYIVGKNKEHSNKYCVLTNWWKERKHNGHYSLPGLDFSLYKTTAVPDDNSDSSDDNSIDGNAANVL